jgi:pimeloyl-ACP methyl ester carboxylesterase
VVSYQHGTVFSKTEVPSHPDESMETRLEIAQFAGQGYIVIAADYFGKGLSPETDSYTVKATTQQACLDMLLAAQAIVPELGVQMGPLFLSGWSQGGWGTMVFLNKLESLGIPVKAVAVASAPVDLYATVNRWVHAPAAIDAVYLPAVQLLQLYAYEEYYGMPGLAQSTIKPEYQETAQALYLNQITYEEAAPQLPTRIDDLLQDDFMAASSIGNDRYYRILQDNNAYRWRMSTPVHTYYGDIDEVVPEAIATLPVGYEQIMGGATVTAVASGSEGDHRGNFVFALADQKKWFDALLGR